MGFKRKQTYMTQFPKFWFEANAYYGNINSLEDLKNLLEIYEGSESVDGVLDKAKNCPDVNSDYYGFRTECNGEKTLRQFLVEKGLNVPVCGNTSIDDYIKSIV